MVNDETGTEALRALVEAATRLPSAEELRAIARKQLAAAAQRAAVFSKAVRPIWMADANGRPTHVGSSVLVEIGTAHFILTAAHVADFAKVATLYIGVEGLQALSQTFEVTVAPDDDRDADVVDFAFMRFPDDLVEKLGDATFVPEKSIGVAELVEGQAYTCLGFPNSKNRDPIWGATTVRNRQMSYTSRGRSVSQLPARARDGMHVLVDRNPYHVRNPDGVRIKAGRSNGFSGGAIFDVGALGTVANILHPQPPRLAAIFTEAHGAEKVILGTRLDFVIGQLRAQGRL